MTGLQMYLLIAPFFLMGVGLLAAWWNHYENERDWKKVESTRARAAE